MLSFFLLSCLSDPTAQMSGMVFDSAGQVFPLATIEVRDGYGLLYASGNADAAGVFTIDLPPFSTFFTVLSAEGHPPTSFTGFAGDGLFEVVNGTLYLRSEEEIADVSAPYSECGSGLGIIDGEVRLAIPEQSTAELPLVETATVSAESEDGSQATACYGTEEESGTGESGSYAIFGLPEGVAIVEVGLDIGNGYTETIEHVVFVPESGTAPLYPTLFPIP
jgi:hypothetical protein